MERTNEIEEIASDWLIRRDAGQWTQIDQIRFEQWLDASISNRVAFLRLELAWEECARMKALGAGISGNRPPPPGQWNLDPFFGLHRAQPDAPDRGSVKQTSRHRLLATAAAMLLGVAVGLGSYALWSGANDRYRTNVGGLVSVPTADGSRITLNTDSEIRVAVDARERRVDLRQGEAFFDVAKDPKRLFVVRVGEKHVIAVGTKFSVRRYGESMEILVTEGKVRVEDAGRSLLRTAFREKLPLTQLRAPESTVFLTPGEIAYADKAGVLIRRMTLQDAESHLSWRSGVLMFRKQNLGDAVAEFNRYSTRKIVITDPAVASLQIEGNFRATNVEGFVRLLQSGFPVRASTHDGQIVLSSRQ